MVPLIVVLLVVGLSVDDLSDKSSIVEEYSDEVGRSVEVLSSVGRRVSVEEPPIDALLVVDLSVGDVSVDLLLVVCLSVAVFADD